MVIRDVLYGFCITENYQVIFEKQNNIKFINHTHGFVPSPSISAKISPLPLVITTVDTEAPLKSKENNNKK